MASWWKKDNELQGLNIGPIRDPLAVKPSLGSDAKVGPGSEVKPTREDLVAAIRSAPWFEEKAKLVRERAVAWADEMMEPSHTPEFIFSLIKPGSEPNKGTLFVLPSSSGPVLLLFTTHYRALDYLEHKGVRQFHVIRLLATSLAQMANEISSAGFKSYAIDYCPRSTELQVFPLGNLSHQRTFFLSWALIASVRRLEAEILVRDLIQTADTEKRVSLLRTLVQHVDPSNPTAYHFLAFTAQETDQSLTDWALNRLKTCWPDYAAEMEPPPTQNGNVEKWTGLIAKLTVGIGIQYGVLKTPQATATS